MSSENLDTRRRILKAALELLEAGRGEGVRMSDIAKKAGISRQAVYLHFTSRAELLIGVTYYLDELHDTESRLAASRTAATGVERLDAFIQAWCSYIPKIYGSGRALMAMSPTDKEAEATWNQRMQDVREGCEAAIDALIRDGDLRPDYTRDDATDILWTLLSVRSWEQLTITCKWPQDKYLASVKSMAQKLLVED